MTEEKAIQMAYDMGAHPYSINSMVSCLIKGAEIGATEQKALDKRLILDAYCKRCLDMCGGYPCSHKCYEYLEFEKTLEE